MSIVLTVKPQGLDRSRVNIAQQQERAKDLTHPLGLLGQHLVKKTQRIVDSGEAGIKTRNRPGLGTSFTYRSVNNSMAVGSNLPYALSQQFGPKDGRYKSNRPGGMLAVPIGVNVGARGNAIVQSPRDIPDDQFTWFKSKSGNFFAGRKNPKAKVGKLTKHKMRNAFRDQRKEAVEGKIELLFLITPSVKGEAHNYCRFDPEDAVVWDRVAIDWIVNGR